MKPTAEYTLPSSFSAQQREDLFDEIVRLYDLADEVMAAVTQENLTNRAVQLELARPFVTQVASSANILSAFYTEVVRNGRPITPEVQDTFENAFKNIFLAYRDFLDGTEQKLAPEGYTGIAESGGSSLLGERKVSTILEKSKGDAKVPLEAKFKKRAKGALQNRAFALEAALKPQTGAELVAAVAKIGRHTGQLILETLDANLNLVRSYDHAVPILGPSSKLARQISATLIEPKHITGVEKIDRIRNN